MRWCWRPCLLPTHSRVVIPRLKKFESAGLRQIVGAERWALFGVASSRFYFVIGPWFIPIVAQITGFWRLVWSCTVASYIAWWKALQDVEQRIILGLKILTPQQARNVENWDPRWTGSSLWHIPMMVINVVSEALHSTAVSPALFFHAEMSNRRLPAFHSFLKVAGALECPETLRRADGVLRTSSRIATCCLLSSRKTCGLSWQLHCQFIFMP